MTKLLWDEIGERRYESGVDRGVLYLPDKSGVPWNGLTAVEEDLSGIETNTFYFDGIKYLDTRSPGDFSATLKAFTYPDEFLPFDGFSELDKGVLLGHQPVYERFGISYRTRIGNDIDGVNHGYKIHILYNLMASPDNRSYTTVSEQQNPLEFSWKIIGVPEEIAWHRPTAHIILDTTRMNRYLIRDLETILYGQSPAKVAVNDVMDGGTPYSLVQWEFVNGGGVKASGALVFDGGTVTLLSNTVVASEDLPANLPPLADLIDLINNWTLIEVTDNGDGLWSATGPDEVVSFLNSSMFQISSSTVKILDSNTYTISTTHSFKEG